MLRNLTKFTGKHLCQSLFFNKVAETLAQVFSCEFCQISKNTFFTEHLRVTLSKKRPWHRSFPVNFVKFLRTTFWLNISGRLLLHICEELLRVNYLIIEIIPEGLPSPVSKSYHHLSTSFGIHVALWLKLT